MPVLGRAVPYRLGRSGPARWDLVAELVVGGPVDRGVVEGGCRVQVYLPGRRVGNADRLEPLVYRVSDHKRLDGLLVVRLVVRPTESYVSVY